MWRSVTIKYFLVPFFLYIFIKCTQWCRVKNSNINPPVTSVSDISYSQNERPASFCPILFTSPPPPPPLEVTSLLTLLKIIALPFFFSSFYWWYMQSRNAIKFQTEAQRLMFLWSVGYPENFTDWQLHLEETAPPTP